MIQIQKLKHVVPSLRGLELISLAGNLQKIAYGDVCTNLHSKFILDSHLSQYFPVFFHIFLRFSREKS